MPVTIAEGAQLVGGLRCFDWSDDEIINPVFAFLTRVAVMIMQALGLQVVMPELNRNVFPFWVFLHDGVIYRGNDSDDA